MQLETFLVSAAVYLKLSLFWDVSQLMLGVGHRRFGTALRSHLKGWRDCLTLTTQKYIHTHTQYINTHTRTHMLQNHMLVMYHAFIPFSATSPSRPAAVCSSAAPSSLRHGLEFEETQTGAQLFEGTAEKTFDPLRLNKSLTALPY
jgi:hypothetical protein